MEEHALMESVYVLIHFMVNFVSMIVILTKTGNETSIPWAWIILILLVVLAIGAIIYYIATNKVRLYKISLNHHG